MLIQILIAAAFSCDDNAFCTSGFVDDVIAVIIVKIQIELGVCDVANYSP